MQEMCLPEGMVKIGEKNWEIVQTYTYNLWYQPVGDVLELMFRIRGLIIKEAPVFPGAAMSLRLPFIPVYNALFIIHHPDDLTLVWCLHGRDWDVSNSPKFAAVVQMFIFKPEEIPHEPPGIIGYNS